MYVDTHCHIHEPSYPLPVDEVFEHAQKEGVTRMIVVGTSLESSAQAIAFAEQHTGCVASIGVHPHDTKDGYDIGSLMGTSEKIAAIGEIGLDYYYTHSPRDIQIAALREQLKVAVEHDVPVIFHVRDAFDDFWPLFDEFKGIRGVLHSFTDTKENMQQALRRGLYIGVNGISTFTKDPVQQAMYDAIPLESMLLETDAPFLTPTPYRGTVNEPAFVSVIAQYHADRRGVVVQEIAEATTANARALFAHLK